MTPACSSNVFPTTLFSSATSRSPTIVSFSAQCWTSVYPVHTACTLRSYTAQSAHPTHTIQPPTEDSGKEVATALPIRTALVAVCHACVCLSSRTKTKSWITANCACSVSGRLQQQHRRHDRHVSPFRDDVGLQRRASASSLRYTPNPRAPAPPCAHAGPSPGRYR